MKFTLICLFLITLNVIGINSTTTQVQDGSQRLRFQLDTSQGGRQKRQTPNAHTGHEAIPPDAVRNPDFRADGTGSPIYQYKQGHNRRIEFLEGIIKKNNIRRGTPCNDATRTFIRDRTPVGSDICGHIIANVLGGSGRLEYNVFPQDKNLNNREWKSFEEKIKTFVNSADNHTANLRFWFDYESATSTRPTYFTVTYNLLEGDNISDNSPFRVRNGPGPQ